MWKCEGAETTVSVYTKDDGAGMRNEEVGKDVA